jgi:hypothetical protein
MRRGADNTAYWQNRQAPNTLSPCFLGFPTANDHTVSPPRSSRSSPPTPLLPDRPQIGVDQEHGRRNRQTDEGRADRRFGAKPDKKIVDRQAASPSS